MTPVITPPIPYLREIMTRVMSGVYPFDIGFISGMSSPATASNVQLLTRNKPEERKAFVEIYKPFFIAGILSVLTAGCLLGAVALYGISVQGSYTASAWTPYVLAHANSQVFGWVGFFIIGFALQQHAPMQSKLRLFNTLAWLSLITIAVGIGLRFAAEPLVRVQPEVWLPVGIGSSVLQAVGVTLFVANIGLTRSKQGKAPWQTLYVFASLFYFIGIAWLDPILFAGSHQSDPNASIQFVAQWFSPYREATFLGFVANMIFGVGLSKFSHCFGYREPLRAWANAAFFLWNLGVIVRIVGWIQFFDAGLAPGAGALYYASGPLLLFGATAAIVAARIFEPADRYLRSHKFQRASLAWLFIAGVLLVWEPVHLSLLGVPFSHAYTGAIRHAVTVGFISQMIIGFSLHVAASMTDRDPTSLPRLWSVFWLINIGNMARVACEVATDFSPIAFAPMGFTGFVELVGLGIWAASVLGLILPKARLASA